MLKVLNLRSLTPWHVKDIGLMRSHFSAAAHWFSLLDRDTWDVVVISLWGARRSWHIVSFVVYLRTKNILRWQTGEQRRSVGWLLNKWRARNVEVDASWRQVVLVGWVLLETFSCIVSIVRYLQLLVVCYYTVWGDVPGLDTWSTVFGISVLRPYSNPFVSTGIVRKISMQLWCASVSILPSSWCPCRFTKCALNASSRFAMCLQPGTGQNRCDRCRRCISLLCRSIWYLLPNVWLQSMKSHLTRVLLFAEDWGGFILAEQ